MLRSTKFLAIAVLIATLNAFATSTGSASECAAELNTKDSGFVVKLISCLKAMERENSTLKETLSSLSNQDRQIDQKALALIREDMMTLKSKIEQIETRPSVSNVGSSKLPQAAVVAFARSQHSGGVCPNGWSLFKEAGGRMIVGAGTNTNKDQNGTDLTDYPSFLDDPINSTGGEEQVKLTEDQMPAHDHKGVLDVSGYSFEHHQGNSRLPGQRWGWTRNTSTAGGNKPHNNMPPFIALYFCIKN